MQKISKSQNLRNVKLISLYDNILFIFRCFHDQQHAYWCKSIPKVLNQKVAKQPNVYLSFFLLPSSSSSSDGLLQTA